MMGQNAEANSATKIFVNLPVKDLKKTMDFFIIELSCLFSR